MKQKSAQWLGPELGLRQDGSDYCNKAWKMRGEREMKKHREREMIGGDKPFVHQYGLFFPCLINIGTVFI